MPAEFANALFSQETSSDPHIRIAIGIKSVAGSDVLSSQLIAKVAPEMPAMTFMKLRTADVQKMRLLALITNFSKGAPLFADT